MPLETEPLGAAAQAAPLTHELVLEGAEHAVLMIHGLGANALELASLAQHLNLQGFSVYVPRIEGYTFGSPCSTWPQWLEIIQAHYLALKARHATVSVLGLSMGATLALMLSSREQPTCVVLLSACLAYNGWAIPFYSFLLRWAPYIPALQKYSFREAEPYGIKNKKMRAMVKRALTRDHIAESGADALSYQQISQGQQLADEVWHHLQKIVVPVFFIHAADDETAHPKSIKQALPKIASKSKRLHLLGDCYHMITVDNERDTVNYEAGQFLKQQVNAALDAKVFDIAPVVLPELQRLLRQERHPKLMDEQ